MSHVQITRRAHCQCQVAFLLNVKSLSDVIGLLQLQPPPPGHKKSAQQPMTSIQTQPHRSHIAMATGTALATQHEPTTTKQISTNTVRVEEPVSSLGPSPSHLAPSSSPHSTSGSLSSPIKGTPSPLSPSFKDAVSPVVPTMPQKLSPVAQTIAEEEHKIPPQQHKKVGKMEDYYFKEGVGLVRKSGTEKEMGIAPDILSRAYTAPKLQKTEPVSGRMHLVKTGPAPLTKAQIQRLKDQEDMKKIQQQLMEEKQRQDQLRAQNVLPKDSVKDIPPAKYPSTNTVLHGKDSVIVAESVAVAAAGPPKMTQTAMNIDLSPAKQPAINQESNAMLVSSSSVKPTAISRELPIKGDIKLTPLQQAILDEENARKGLGAHKARAVKHALAQQSKLLGRIDPHPTEQKTLSPRHSQSKSPSPVTSSSHTQKVMTSLEPLEMMTSPGPVSPAPVISPTQKSVMSSMHVPTQRMMTSGVSPTHMTSLSSAQKVSMSPISTTSSSPLLPTQRTEFSLTPTDVYGQHPVSPTRKAVTSSVFGMPTTTTVSTQTSAMPERIVNTTSRSQIRPQVIGSTVLPSSKMAAETDYSGSVEASRPLGRSGYTGPQARQQPLGKPQAVTLTQPLKVLSPKTVSPKSPSPVGSASSTSPQPPEWQTKAQSMTKAMIQAQKEKEQMTTLQRKLQEEKQKQDSQDAIRSGALSPSKIVKSSSTSSVFPAKSGKAAPQAQRALTSPTQPSQGIGAGQQKLMTSSEPVLTQQKPTLKPTLESVPTQQDLSQSLDQKPQPTAVPHAQPMMISPALTQQQVVTSSVPVQKDAPVAVTSQVISPISPPSVDKPSQLEPAHTGAQKTVSQTPLSAATEPVMEKVEPVPAHVAMEAPPVAMEAAVTPAPASVAKEGPPVAKEAAPVAMEAAPLSRIEPPVAKGGPPIAMDNTAQKLVSTPLTKAMIQAEKEKEQMRLLQQQLLEEKERKEGKVLTYSTTTPAATATAGPTAVTFVASSTLSSTPVTTAVEPIPTQVAQPASKMLPAGPVMSPPAVTTSGKKEEFRPVMSPTQVASPVRVTSPNVVASPVRVTSPAAMASPLKVTPPVSVLSQIGVASPVRVASPAAVASPARVASPAGMVQPQMPPQSNAAVPAPRMPAPAGMSKAFGSGLTSPARPAGTRQGTSTVNEAMGDGLISPTPPKIQPSGVTSPKPVPLVTPQSVTEPTILGTTFGPGPKSPAKQQSPKGPMSPKGQAVFFPDRNVDMSTPGRAPAVTTLRKDSGSSSPASASPTVKDAPVTLSGYQQPVTIQGQPERVAQATETKQPMPQVSGAGTVPRTLASQAPANHRATVVSMSQNIVPSQPVIQQSPVQQVQPTTTAPTKIQSAPQFAIAPQQQVMTSPAQQQIPVTSQQRVYTSQQQPPTMIDHQHKTVSQPISELPKVANTILQSAMVSQPVITHPPQVVMATPQQVVTSQLPVMQPQVAMATPQKVLTQPSPVYSAQQTQPTQGMVTSPAHVSQPAQKSMTSPLVAREPAQVMMTSSVPVQPQPQQVSF